MTNKKAFVIVGSYYPNIDANGACVQLLIEKIVKEGYKVDIYVLRRHAEEKDYATAFGNVFYFDTAITSVYNKLAQRGIEYLNLPLPIKAIIKSYVFLKKLPYEYFSCEYTDSVLYSKIISRVIAQNNIAQYEIMINVSHPFGFTKLAYKIKRKLPDLKWVQYMLDPFVYNYNSEPKRVEKRKKQFLKFTDGVDKLLLTRGIDSENKRQNYFHGLETRQTTVDLPNLVKYSDETVIKKNREGVECLFAGLFYKDIRNPKEMFEVMDKINIDKLRLIILGGEGCKAVTDKYQKSMGNKLKLMEKIPLEKCRSRFLSTDILVNLGNTIPNQIPSKVFEYISTGKPVINFYTNENDTSLYYFEKYPLAFNFNLSKYDNARIAELEAFIVKNKDKRNSFEEATANMQECLSENVVQKIFDFILS